jgi:dihydrofolate reductase
MSTVTMIVARGARGEIGKNGTMPWKISADLKFFKEKTLGKPVIMGRKTWESIGRPLPGRKNIVISRGHVDLPDSVILVSSLEAALAAASDAPEIMIIGGSQIYRQARDLADEAWVTQINGTFDADAFFEALDDSWRKTESIQASEGDITFAFEHFVHEKKNKEGTTVKSQVKTDGATELMQLAVPVELKEKFCMCVSRAYEGKLEEGILDLMRIYVERAMSNPRQSEIRENIRETVYTGDLGGGPKGTAIEKALLNKTDEEIEANRL